MAGYDTVSRVKVKPMHLGPAPGAAHSMQGALSLIGLRCDRLGSLALLMQAMWC